MDDFNYEEREGKKKFVITRGILILGIIILIVIVALIVFLVTKFGKSDKITTTDFKKLEERMVEEAPIYVYQKNIELTDKEIKINLKELLEENGGTINSDKVKAAKVCEGYVIAVKNESESYTSYIKCGSSYTTSGYVGSDKETTTARKTTGKDNEKPIITIIGEKELSIYVGDNYNDAGAKAFDNVDGDITSRIKTEGKVDSSKPGTYKIKYEVTDKAGNKDSVTRTIVVKIKETTTTKKNTTTTTNRTSKVTTTTRKVTTNPKPQAPPIIMLNGSGTIRLKVGERYVDPGYTASDCYGKNITSRVNVSGNVSTGYPGTYTIKYSVTDSYGNSAITYRIVIVESNNIPVTSVSISPNSFTLSVGESRKLDVFISPSNASDKTLSWSSDNLYVATVSSSGVVYAHAKGTARITVKTYNGKTAMTRVTVK